MPRPKGLVGRGDGRQVRILGMVAIVVVFVLAISMRGIANFYTDYLWFDALELGQVWSGILGAKIILALTFIGFFWALMWVNLILADRIAPDFRAAGPEGQILARYHDAIGGRVGPVRLAVSGLFALSAGIGAAAQWNNWILFRNSIDFGMTDPVFNRDISFYVFQMPFLTFVVDWLFTALVITLIVTAGAHYVNGGIRLQAPGEERATPQVKAHLSVLLGLMSLVKAIDYWLARFELTTSSNGVVDGATYTDINARLPVFNLLILIALFAAALFLFNIRRKGWVLPAVAVGLWSVVSIIMQGFYPFVVQRIVDGSEVEREEQYIARNIEATRFAYGIDDVVIRDFAYDENLTPDDIPRNQDNLLAVPLLDRAIVDEVFRLNQVELESFQFPDQLDVDRYTIDGEVVPVVLGARSLNVSGLSRKTWVSEHISFTHGNGVAIAPASPMSKEVQYVLEGVPLENRIPDELSLEQPRIYHGENVSGYAIVNASVSEVDFIDDNDTEVRNRYDGTAGVPLGGLFRQIAFALRFSSLDPLISNLVSSDSKVIYIRDIEDRLGEVAPFIEYDADPYPVIAEDRVFFVVDGYTTSSRFPYSQRADRGGLASGDLRRGANFNYVRNSVKAVVDSYDGTVTLYVIDEEPIIQAYRQAFPDLFAPLSEMSAEVQAHLRYPEDMFTVQTNMLGRYQIDDASQFYNRAGGWDVAQGPGSVKTQTNVDVIGDDGVTTTQREARVDPYYTYLRLPDDANAEVAEELDADFVLMRSYVELSVDDKLKEMTAFVAGKGDFLEDDYGELVLYRIQTEDGGVAGPALAASNMSSQEKISEKISLLDVEGTEVQLDDLLIVPVENSLLYIRPFYVTPTTGAKEPQLEWVIAAYGDAQVMCPTFNATLEALFGVSLRDDGLDSSRNNCVGDIRFTSTAKPTTGEPTIGAFEGDNAEILNEVARLLTEADLARSRGDLGDYQRYVDDAVDLLQGNPDEAEADAEADEPAPEDGEPA